MSAKILGFRTKLTNLVQSNTEKVSTSLGSIKLPNRLQGTIIEKWLNYWRQLAIDYKDVALDVGKEIRAKPLKAGIIGSLAASAYLAAKRNPDETSFIDQLRRYNSEMVLIHESCHNSNSSQHLKFIERCYNEGVVRRLSLGVVSFIWLDNYDKSLAIYKAMCPYLQPQYINFGDRIVDVGFWNKWWKLEKQMVDYDINL